MFKPSNNFFIDRLKAVLLLWILFVIYVSSLSVILSCMLLAALWRPDHFTLLYVISICVFVTFRYGVLGQVWYLIVSLPDLCLLPYYVTNNKT